jgi:tetratricopeptide (TPR) repeat protein
MTTLKFISIFIIIGFCSCGQNRGNKPDPNAIRLNDSAVSLIKYINKDSTQKAISLLDKATLIDSNYFLGYYNKRIFQTGLKQYNDAIKTTIDLIRIKPFANELYMTGGLLYEITGDTISAKKYFEKSLSICNSVLDTMKSNNSNYEIVAGNKAINLKMLGKEKEANKFLETLYEKQTDSNLKQAIMSWATKSKSEILEEMSRDDQYSR